MCTLVRITEYALRNRAAVFICHGVGEHCQAYSKLAHKLTDCNMLVFGHDHGELITLLVSLAYCKWTDKRASGSIGYV